jgi:hypothetical protein
MSKLEIEFEITGLKFRISGEKDSVPAALASLQRQVAGLAQSVVSATTALDGNSGSTAVEPSLVEATRGMLPASTIAQPTQPAQRKSRKPGGGRKETAGALEFKHDAEKLGFPKQEWNTATKAMWLLYVLEQSGGPTEGSAPALAATFNKYFKESGGIQRGNISRDLGSAKGKTGFVNSDPTKEPETWFLLTAGKTHIQQLIANSNSVEASAAK